MTIEYQINEQDFLDYQLFTVSQSKSIKKKKRSSWIFLTTGTTATSVYFYLNQDIALFIYFGLVALIFGLFYPKYFKWRYKRHYTTFIKENYSKRFDQTVYLEICNDTIFAKDLTGEGRINISEIERIDETNKHLFLKISTGASLILPKKGLNNLDDVKERLQSLGLTIHNMENWKWE